ncbi:tRNA (guanine(37)-N(1))-methyltransferase-like [Lycorma delicatula]|uniref:tRNA (guanine(37)-N(1))-methyltransferase-like n=1 Tax=Lycorma delicatula TaxID=130591 RepID=UPI003F514915
MNNSLFFLNSLKLIIFVKFHTNTLIKPIDCRLLDNVRMCSDKFIGTNSLTKILMPSSDVKGMKHLDKNAFTKTVSFPSLVVEINLIRDIQALVKPYFSKLINFKPLQDYENNVAVDNKNKKCKKCFLLSPDLVSSFNSLDESVINSLKSKGITEKNFTFISKEVTFDNWKTEDMLEAVLPENLSFSGYSIIGHIAHFNLRTELLDYKYVIGEIILNKVKGIRTVVNKINVIESTYRNFQMELICGENDMKAKLKENSCTFEMDFSTVYWNSRLSKEHERIIDKLREGDVLYDIFAGVGPFSVPAAKKGCIVVANDLNPESVKWLKHNLLVNKVNKNATVFNKDAKDFILNDLKQHLLNINQIKQNSLDYRVHITMNLPSTAVNYITEFHGLFTETEYKLIPKDIFIHLYCFIKSPSKDEKYLMNCAKELVESSLGKKLNVICEIFKVRHVAPNKDMFRVSFLLDSDILLRKSIKRAVEEDKVTTDLETKKI